MSENLHALMSGIAEGEMDALGELYDLLSGRIFNYALTITRNREMAEDITHDVFLQINRHAVRIAKLTNPTSYIMVTTRNHCYNLLKRGSQAAVSLNDILEVSDISSPYDRVLFDDAYSRLPPSQRETIYLHLICGFSHKDVAQIQNAPLVTIKWRYGKALARLKAYFTQGEKEENYNESL